MDRALVPERPLGILFIERGYCLRAASSTIAASRRKRKILRARRRPQGRQVCSVRKGPGLLIRRPLGS
jgi:hypothetical protein